MPVDIACPECSKTYSISEKNLGRKVICSRKGCGSTFVAEVPPPQGEFDFGTDMEQEEFSLETIEISTKSTPPVIKQIVSEEVIQQVNQPASATPSLEFCSFAVLGRMFLFFGLLLVLFAVVCPYMVPALDGGNTFNFPRAMMKLFALLLGMIFTITGAQFRTASSVKPGLIEMTVTAFLVVAIVAGGVYSAMLA